MLEDFKAVNDAFPIVFQVASFVFGAIVGSFLNVCIYRIPEKRSISHPGSTCACGKPIAWYDNIPILSWFILRGKARCCNSPYSFRYPSIEALTGVLFLFAWLNYPPEIAAIQMFFISLLVCASFIDLDHMEIPDRFSMGTAFFGLLLSVIIPQLHGQQADYFIVASTRAFFDSLIGLLVGSGVILWIAIVAEKLLKKEAMGFGDVKLMGGIGAFLGWKGSLFAIFGGSLIGTMMLAIVLLAQNLIPSLRKNKEEKAAFGKHIPFGPMLSMGAVVYALFFRSEIDRYFEDVVKLLSGNGLN